MNSHRIERIRSVNPFTGAEVTSYIAFPETAVNHKIQEAHAAFGSWRRTSIEDRQNALRFMAALLLGQKDHFAKVIAMEMGKPVAQGRAEIEKCATLCSYYATSLPEILAPTFIATDAYRSYVKYDPVGVWLAIMPWNFPFWQALRCAVPAIAAGNTVILKHASNVSGCAYEIEKLVAEAFNRDNILTTIVIRGAEMERIVRHPNIKGVSLTGSENAGRSVAAEAGRNIKPVVLELGGSNAFIVMDDANIDKAVAHAIIGRFQNSGQSCIAAKRILLHDKIYDAFMEKFLKKVQAMRVGDPMLEETYIGPLARLSDAEELNKQVQRTVAMGAELLCGGTHEGALYQPTVLGNVTPSMPAFREELFGPVAAVMRFHDFEEALMLSNSTKYGLGVSIYTANIEMIDDLLSEFDEGAVFVNSIVKSDPRLPFGGTKNSGLGRELSHEGLYEFVNKKTIYIDAD